MEMIIGKCHVTVHSVFSETSTESAADKAWKLILQHMSDPQLSEKQFAIARDKSEYRRHKGGASDEGSV